MSFNNNSFNYPHFHHSPHGNRPKLPEEGQIGLIIGAVIGLCVASPLLGAALGATVGTVIGLKKS